jgi:hypothetical protein
MHEHCKHDGRWILIVALILALVSAYQFCLREPSGSATHSKEPCDTQRCLYGSPK